MKTEMQETPLTAEQQQTIVKMVTDSFPSFGGGQTSHYNPITNALKDRPPQFAAGVDISKVVSFILYCAANPQEL